LPLATLTDLGKSRSQLIAENALLRQQLIILKRQVKRPACTETARVLPVLLTRWVRTWQQALLIVQPDTLLRWHRELFRFIWKRKSKAVSHKPKIAAETITLIREMTKKNRLWGAERMRGELLKLDIRRSQADHPEVYEADSRHFEPGGRAGKRFCAIRQKTYGPALCAASVLMRSSLQGGEVESKGPQGQGLT